MKIPVNIIENILFKVLYIAVFGIIFMQTLDISILISAFFYLALLVTVILWGISLIDNISKEDYLVMMIIGIAIISVFINFLVSGGTFSFSYFKKVLLFAIVLMFLQFANKYRVNHLKKRFVMNVMDAITVLFIVMFILQGENKYLINGVVSNYLTFQFSNPNLVAMFLFCLFMFQSMTLINVKNIALLDSKDKAILGIRIIMLLILTYFIYLTKARNTQLVMIMYVLAYAWIFITKQTSFNLNIKISSFLSLFPILFFSGYMLFIENSLIQNIFGFMQTVGKGLDSRLKIWVPAWQNFLKSPIFGAYYQVSEGSGAAHLHNSHLDVLASFGIIVFIGICFYLCILIYQKNRKYKTKEDFCFMVAFIATLLLGMGETAIFSAALGIYVIMGTFLLLSHGERKKSHENNSIIKEQNN